MAYEVTATRRRPQQFKNLVGQEFVASTLSNSIASGKIAHAYLFSGPRGCGKTSTARILAKSLNCQKGPTATPCGECSNCQEITKGTSLDVIEIDGASNTSVENIRQIKDEVLFPPSNSKYKIYIIDEVHMLSTSAFNALLKTIEEPPPYVIFIFATTELQKVPATIKSRCQQFNFRLVAIDKVKQCLSEAAAELNIKSDDEALFWIARESTGSMRDAYTLFDQVVAFSEGHITYEKIRDKLGLVGVERLNSLFEACVSKNPIAVSDLLDEYIQNGVSIEQLVTNSADYLRSLLLIKSGVTKESLLGNSIDRYSKTVLNTWSLVQIERGLSIFLNLYRDIRYSLSPRYELELAFSRICFLGEYVSSAEVKKAIDSASALLMSGASSLGDSSQTISSSLSQNSAIPKNSFTSNSENDFSTSKTSENSIGDSLGIHIPKGLPRLSMLGNSEESSNENQLSNGSEFSSGSEFPNGSQLTNGEKQFYGNTLPQGNDSKNESKEVFDNEYEEGGGEKTNPFYNGGSLPPEQTAIEQLVTEETLTKQTVTEESNSTCPVQLTDTFFLPKGGQLSIAQLRGSVMAALSVNDGFAASALEKTGLWEIKDESIETSVVNSYDYELVSKKLSVIEEEVSKVCEKTMKFIVRMEQTRTPLSRHVELPLPVKILVNVFKGTVVAGKL